ncbi:M23 family metallopeptidase [Rhodoligotrophos defluvii]|uniref:M23 family metallopeptidase n=1 Tax=Rhodoligotrophos defluvii TaxID=2561934 RepID=UPI001484D871|nr:M23 family metallopeptidase [Rhodoligotrophos defluvii]
MTRLLRQAFRERQIYVRSEGDIRYIVLSPTIQVLACVLGGGLLFWLAYATVNVAFKEQIIALHGRRLAETKHAYQARLSDMRNAVEMVNDRLLLNQDEYLARIEALRRDYQALLSRQQMLETYVHQGWAPSVYPQRELDPEPAAARPTAEPADLPPESTDDSGKQGSLDPGSIPSRYAAPFRTAAAAQEPLNKIEALAAALAQRHASVIERMDEKLAQRVAAVRRMAGRLGIPPARLIADSNAAGDTTAPGKLKPADAVGGPFVPIASFERSDPLWARLEAVEARRTELAALHEGLDALPLAVPLGQHTVTSGFGPRRDPFHRKRAMHLGVDLRAEFGAPVLATAAGIVVEAQWSAGYGKSVVIYHDKGVSTRYAHLSAISVVPGQRVAKRQVIGRLGNSGRSTGAHLHYETRVDGRAVDPQRFWQARNDLQRQE